MDVCINNSVLCSDVVELSHSRLCSCLRDLYFVEFTEFVKRQQQNHVELSVSISSIETRLIHEYKHLPPYTIIYVRTYVYIDLLLTHMIGH